MVRVGQTGGVMLGGLVDERQRRRLTDAMWGHLLDRLQPPDG